MKTETGGRVLGVLVGTVVIAMLAASLQAAQAPIRNPKADATLSGIVLTYDGIPVKGATVTITPTDRTPRETYRVVTGADGKFTMRMIPGGIYAVAAEVTLPSVRGNQTLSVAKRVSVVPRAETFVELRFERVE